MQPSLHVPSVVRFKKAEQIQKAMLQIQAAEGGRVNIVSINYDSGADEWVVFYYPVKNVDGGVF